MNKIHVQFLAAIAAFPMAFAAEPAPNADANSVLTLEKLITLVPADAKLKRGSKWETLGTAVATQALKTNALGKNAEFTVKVAHLVPHPYSGHAICMDSKPVTVKINGTSLPCVVYAYFDADSLAGIAAVHAGDTITVSGVLNRAEFQVDQEPRLLFEMLQSRLKQPKKD